MKKLYLLVCLLLLSFITYSKNNTVINNINLSPSPITDFVANVFYPNCNYAQAHFYYNTDTVFVGTISIWNFGDGTFNGNTSSNGAVHNYSVPGTYTVTLTVIRNGDTTIISKPNLITIRNPPIAKFIATYSDTLLFAPTTVVCTNQTIKGDGDSLKYTWSFNNDTSILHDTNISHTCLTPATYYINLNVTDNYGCNINYSNEIIIKDTAQKGEISYITSACDNGSSSPCGYQRHFVIENDTLKVFGYIFLNCCGIKTVTIRYNQDTVKIRQFQVGPLCTCNCGFCFAINVPDIIQDSIYVAFYGQTVLVTKSMQSIGEAPTLNSITIYPNPAKDNLTLETNSNTNQSLEIINIVGQTIYTSAVNKKKTIDVSNFPKGIYVLKLNTDKGIIVKKFIKE